MGWFTYVKSHDMWPYGHDDSPPIVAVEADDRNAADIAARKHAGIDPDEEKVPHELWDETQHWDAFDEPDEPEPRRVWTVHGPFDEAPAVPSWAVGRFAGWPDERYPYTIAAGDEKPHAAGAARALTDDGEPEVLLVAADGTVADAWRTIAERDDLDGNSGWSVTVHQNGTHVYDIGENGWSQDGNSPAPADWRDAGPDGTVEAHSGYGLAWYPTRDQADAFADTVNAARKRIHRAIVAELAEVGKTDPHAAEALRAALLR